MEEYKKILISKLKDENIFWSYEKPDYDSFSNEDIIANVILYLDTDDIDILFQLFDFDSIKNTWIRDILSLDRYYSLNRLLAYVYFGIKEPDEFIKKNRIHL